MQHDAFLIRNLNDDVYSTLDEEELGELLDGNLPDSVRTRLNVSGASAGGTDPAGKSALPEEGEPGAEGEEGGDLSPSGQVPEVKTDPSEEALHFELDGTSFSFSPEEVRSFLSESERMRRLLADPGMVEACTLRLKLLQDPEFQAHMAAYRGKDGQEVSLSAVQEQKDMPEAMNPEVRYTQDSDFQEVRSLMDEAIRKALEAGVLRYADADAIERQLLTSPALFDRAYGSMKSVFNARRRGESHSSLADSPAKAAEAARVDRMARQGLRRESVAPQLAGASPLPASMTAARQKILWDKALQGDLEALGTLMA